MALRVRRLYFYRAGNDFIITHGAVKKTDKADRNEFERARRIQGEIEAAETAAQADKKNMTGTTKGKNR